MKKNRDQRKSPDNRGPDNRGSTVGVSLVTNCIQREQSNNLLLLHQGCQHIENGTAADEGEVGGGGEG